MGKSVHPVDPIGGDMILGARQNATEDKVVVAGATTKIGAVAAGHFPRGSRLCVLGIHQEGTIDTTSSSAPW